MKLFKVLFIVFTFLCASPNLLTSQSNNSVLDNTKISILTCRSGEMLYTTFGHTAIRIFNPVTNDDIVYNYGIFNFQTSNFYVKFMRGQLPYYLGVTKMDSFLEEYDYYKRSVFEQELILDNSQKRQIIEFLIDNSKPENRAYKYDFFFDNCATRVVDVYSTTGDVSYTNKIDKKTFRDLLKENLQNLVWSDFGIDIVIGQRADKITTRRDQMFLPEYVKLNLENALLNSVSPVAKPPSIVLDYEDLNSRRKRKSTNWPLICASIIFFITLLVNIRYTKFAKVYNKSLLLISGVLGLFLLFMWFGTNHGATRDNWNVLWLNPVTLVYLYTKSNIRKVIGYILIVLFVLSGLNCLYQFLPQFFNLAFLPLILSFIVICYFELFNGKMQVENTSNWK